MKFFHTKKPIEILREMKSSENGLAEDEAIKRQEAYGFNELPDDGGLSLREIIWEQFKSPLVIVLMIAVVISYVLNEIVDAAIILAIILINAIIGFVQEFKANQSIQALKHILVVKAQVMRDGNVVEVDAKYLVPGDIVLLSAGMKVPADIRLIQSNTLEIDESVLTGESLPVAKDPTVIDDDSTPIADQQNMAFTGTIVVRGSGKGIVVGTGLDTELGKVADTVTSTEINETPLQKSIASLAKKISIAALVGAFIIFLVGWLEGLPLSLVFKDVVAISVAVIPEGLPIVVTVALAVGIQRMANQKAIIRYLPAAETLGSTTVICSDKTGTLTKNEMTVKEVYTLEDGKHFEVSGDGYSIDGSIIFEHNPISVSPVDTIYRLLIAGTLANESRLTINEHVAEVQGDPTEGAILVAAKKVGIHYENLHDEFQEMAMLPFESEREYMSTIQKQNEQLTLHIKGSPEALVAMSNDDEANKKLLENAESCAKRGMRVIAVGEKQIEDIPEELDDSIHEDITLLGYFAMIDPPRTSAIEAVKHCQEAGIRVIMITGDHAETAKNIAVQTGIVSSDDASVLRGKDIKNISDEELTGVLRDTSVFARVAPTDKLRIVTLLQQQGEVVAVTGDGVNDAPALKAAEIGVAMGKVGTDVAKEAARMVILDDNFATIVKAIEQGRIVFENIRKVTFFLIPTGLAAFVTIFATMLLQLPIPYTAIQLLWINLVTNGLQDVSLAFEPGEKDILRKSPRNRHEPIMNKSLIVRSISVAVTMSIGILALYLWELDSGASTERARTIAFNTMVFFQFFQLLNVRSHTKSIFKTSLLTNKFLFVSFVGGLLVQYLAIYAPFLEEILETVPVTGYEIAFMAAVAFSVVIVVEIEKFILRKRGLE